VRVLVISNMYPTATSPLGTFIKEQIADLAACGVEVARVVKRGERLSGYIPFLARSAVRCLSAAHDLVHAHYGFHSGLIPELLKTRPTVVTFHRGDALNEPERNRLYRRLQRYVVARADHIICVSREVEDALEGLGADPSRMTRLSCGVNTARFAPASDKQAIRRRLGLGAEGLLVVFSGALCERKGVDVLLECARRMADLRFVFVGEGPLKARLPNCRFVGARSHAEMALWLNAGDIFALPSRSEGLPVALLEAMACALPVVCTDVGDCREAVRDGKTGLIVPANDPDVLGDRIGCLARDAGVRRKLGEAARSHVLAHYSGQAIASRIIGIYRQVLATPGRP
jgi:glycosyltransferase involved in cell wall biosynthesis